MEPSQGASVCKSISTGPGMGETTQKLLKELPARALTGMHKGKVARAYGETQGHTSLSHVTRFILPGLTTGN